VQRRNDQRIKKLTMVLRTTLNTRLQCVTGRVFGADEIVDVDVKVEAEVDAADNADLTPELGALGGGVVTASPIVVDRVVSERLVGFEVWTLSTERNADDEDHIDRNWSVEDGMYKLLDSEAEESEKSDGSEEPEESEESEGPEESSNVA
jgi:hypothetical protein